ncbi:MAG: transglutaminase-like domain-containing protein, partial [Polyangiales bacterium]
MRRFVSGVGGAVAVLLVPFVASVAGDAGAQPKPAASASASPSGGAGKGKPPKIATSASAEGGGTPKLPPASKAGPPPKPEELWVVGSTDDTLAQWEKRAVRDALAGGKFAIGSIVAIPQIADEARAGSARAALLRIATALSADKSKPEARELAGEALAIARSLAPDAGTDAGRVEDAKLGLVSAWKIVAPFRDTTGTGLDRAEGPEIAVPEKTDKPVSIALFKQPDGAWDDGPYDVRWRSVPTQLISARGVPLEVLVYPRKESCSYLASSVTVANEGPVVVRVAAAGAVRMIWDGVTVGRSDEQHGSAIADRLATRIEATKGQHLLALKVCSGPNADSGRVRARVTNEAGEPAGITFTDDLSKLPAAANPPKFSAILTPLQKALAVSDKSATTDEALAAALARVLGGADDLRSSKAQGLLDLVVTQNPRPDVLALAGLLAPARSNITRWLGSALERSGDDPVYKPVELFARRSLAEARLNAGYVDWTAATIASSELKTAPDLEARVLRARLLDGLGQDEAAYGAYKAIWDSEGDKTPTYVLRAIAAVKFGRPDVAAKARAQAVTVWAAESARDFVSSKKMQGPDALKQAAIGSFRMVRSSDEIESIAAILHGAGLFTEERRYLGLATIWAPNKKGVFDALAQNLAAATDPKEKDLAKESLIRARQLDPGNPFLRAEENLAFGEQHPDDEQYMPTPKTFLAKRLPKDKLPTADANSTAPLEVYDRQLDWLRVVTVDDAGRVAQLIHYTREIVKPIKDASDLDEPHVPAEGDIVEVVRARVHRLDGTIAVPQEIDEGGNLRIRWTDLKPGDVVEVATRGYTEVPIGERSAPPFYFMDYAGGPTTHPVLYNEVIVRTPKKRPLYTAVVNAELDKTMQHDTSVDPKTGKNIERYVWASPISLPEEPLQPRGSEIFPTLIGSQFKTWDDFIVWYKSGVESFASVDPRVKRRADELTKKAKGRDEKIASIFNWIADQVKYVNYVSAEQWLPNRPQNVLDRMQGDCDDKAMLLITMLKAIGITEAQEVLVQTRYTGMPSVITAKGAVAPMFDHGIAFLPGQNGKGDRYLDATSPESRLGPLPAMDARASAIRVVFGGTTPIVTLPA